MKKSTGFEVGSGNVFADIGLPNAQEHMVKAQLVYKIDGLMKARRLRQVEVAKLFGVKQPDVSKMLRGDFRQFSVERLLRFLVALGQDVEIVVKPHRGTRDVPQLRVRDEAVGPTGLVTEWATLASDVRDAGLEIFGTANVPVTSKGFADEKVLALMLLARTLSNVKGALLLLDAKRVVEARTITRCCFENLYWSIGLAEEGDSFVRKMRDDEMSHRRAQGQSIFAAEVQLEENVNARLREFMKGANKKFGNARTLTPKQVAQVRRDFERTYIFYGHLSSDSAHPSVSALNRYAVSDTEHEAGGIDVEPVVSEKELAETFEYLSMAAIGVCVAVNQIIDGAKGGETLNAIADRYSVLSNRTQAQFKKAA